MTTPPRQPEQVEILDLTETEGDPTGRAEFTPEKRTSMSFRLMIAKLLVLETILDEPGPNFQTSALLQFTIIMIVVGAIMALVNALSDSLWIALGAAVLTFAAAVLYVRTAKQRKDPPA